MLRVLLSWLFDQSHFPAALLGLSADRLRADVGAGLNAKRRPETVERGPDQWPLIDSRLLYQCCPCLNSWRTLLRPCPAAAAAAAGPHRPSAPRKITPVAARDPPHGPPVAAKSTQILLEERSVCTGIDLYWAVSNLQLFGFFPYLLTFIGFHRILPILMDIYSLV